MVEVTEQSGGCPRAAWWQSPSSVVAVTEQRGGDRIPLVVTRLKGAYTLPLFPREDNQLPAPGPYTLGELTLIVPRYLCVCMCVCVFNPVCTV